ncbi:hypothetical protein ABIC09_007587 [Bradyrhizobium sp. S3.12.5]
MYQRWTDEPAPADALRFWQAPFLQRVGVEIKDSSDSIALSHFFTPI